MVTMVKDYNDTFVVFPKVPLFQVYMCSYNYKKIINQLPHDECVTFNCSKFLIPPSDQARVLTTS